MKLEKLVSTPLRDNPENVEYTLEVVVSPDNVVDATYSVFSPDQNKALVSVTLSYAIEEKGIVKRSLNGTNVFLPIGFVGQELRGDLGYSKALLPDIEGEEHYCAILSGTLVDQKTGDESNFFVFKIFEI